MERRIFLRNTSTAALLSPLFADASVLNMESINAKLLPLSKLSKPLAIAMWDYSWILRHHTYGEFLNWDEVLDGLAERGYNAIRIDAMPQYVAADMDGTLTNQFRSIKKDWVPAKWGNDYTMSFNPREALKEFLPKCKKYGIRVGLAGWFLNHCTGDRKIFGEEGGLLRAWKETLTFLKKENLLDDNIIYVDLLNEYPFWHGYDWLKKQIDDRGDIKKFKLNNPNANVPDNLEMNANGLNIVQKQFYNSFAHDLIKEMKIAFPGQIYHMSLMFQMPLDAIDLSQFGTLDYHTWFEASGQITGLADLSSIDQAKDNKLIYEILLSTWHQKKPELVQWMDTQITNVSNTALKHNIPCGNTEGWGPISWLDHPEIDWDWVKECGEICIDLALKHGNYKYICTSNFTHPQFKGMWEDIRWHQKMTAKIKE